MPRKSCQLENNCVILRRLSITNEKEVKSENRFVYMTDNHDNNQQTNVRVQRSITLGNNVEQVPLLAAFVDEVCEAVGLDMSVTMSMNLALEEAVVNVMKYAYPKGVQGDVLIEVKADDRLLTFVIIDHGTPFDPTLQEEADTSLSAEERPIGGLGIFLVRQLMDGIGYERADDRNILTLTKKL